MRQTSHNLTGYKESKTMDWSGEGMILGSTRFGETSAIVDVFCAEQGRWSGLVRGGASRRLAPHLQAGTQVGVVWRARLENHLGNFQIEPLKSRATLMNDTVSLSAFSSLCALLRFGTPERLAMGRLYENTLALVDRLERGADWHKNGKTQVARYIVWEVGLLQALGYGLDLSCCALSGVTTDLAYVSPKTGRAVERSAAEPWKERLLPLPAFFISVKRVKWGILIYIKCRYIGGVGFERAFLASFLWLLPWATNPYPPHADGL